MEGTPVWFVPQFWRRQREQIKCVTTILAFYCENSGQKTSVCGKREKQVTKTKMSKSNHQSQQSRSLESSYIHTAAQLSVLLEVHLFGGETGQWISWILIYSINTVFQRHNVTQRGPL